MPRPPLNPGRLAAGRILLEVERGGHAEDLLARLAPKDPGDRALAWNLVLGVLRTRSALDAAITTAARRALRTMDPPVVAACRVGAWEQRYARVPDYAAVDQAVELARGLGAAHAAGFVNAVLRRQGSVEVPPDALLGHPAWIVRRWRARHGADADRWMLANNEPAAVHLVPKEDPAGVARELQHAGIVATPVGATLRLPPRAGAVTELPGFAEGRWWVMDPAAVEVADLVGELAPGVPVLDACAAPGGKSFRLAARGARVLATDVNERRLDQVRQGAARLGLPVEARLHDWTTGPLPQKFPVVLLDAPCSGLGVLRRHPEIRWRRQEEDLAASAQRQRQILGNVLTSLAPGGVLVYAVCSPEPEEALPAGLPVEATFANAPAVDGADVFQAWRIRG